MGEAGGEGRVKYQDVTPFQTAVGNSGPCRACRLIVRKG